MKEFEELKGKIIKRIDINEEKTEMKITLSDGSLYKFYHYQDCCENVYIEDVIGNLDDLLDTEIIMAESVSNNENPLPGSDESHTWTFYKFGTIKGYVTIRWYGESNGYYSEDVDFVRVK